MSLRDTARSWLGVDTLEREREQLEADMALVLELMRARTPGGQLYLGEEAQARARQILPQVRQVSQESGQLPGGPVPPELILAIIWTESHFRPDAVGPDTSPRPGSQSAHGLMQIFHTNLGEELGPWPGVPGELVVGRGEVYEPLPNIRAGVRILLSCGWGQGTPAREVFRCYSGARPGNLEAINDYTDKVTNRHIVLRWGGAFGFHSLEV